MELRILCSEDLMARISLVAPETAPDDVKEIYEKVLRGKPGNVQKALAHRPEMLKNFLSFYSSVGRSLDRKLYEMIYLKSFADQPMPVLHAASSGFVETNRTGSGKLGSSQGRRLFELQPKRAGRAKVYREVDEKPARHQ